jgi:hypothetical protein
MTTAQSFWFAVEIFFLFAYLIVLFQIVGDLFRDKDLSGWLKAIWIFFLIVVPLFAALVYLIARGRGMSRRTAEARTAAREGTESYIRTVAGTSPAQEIAAAKELLESGAITPEEFAGLKARALSTAA